jgi:hypothetical protein
MFVLAQQHENFESKAAVLYAVISENILLWYYQMDPKIQTNLKLLDILSK